MALGHGQGTCWGQKRSRLDSADPGAWRQKRKTRQESPLLTAAPHLPSVPGFLTSLTTWSVSRAGASQPMWGTGLSWPHPF